MLGPKLTVITDSTNGANAFDGNEVIKMGIYTDTRPVVDKTGAGDAFASGFLAALFYKKSLKEALAWGVVNSGACIKEIGSIHGLLNKDEIEKIVKSLKTQL
jgi:ribokinase